MSVPPPRIPDYQLLRCIGRGSYGEVWLARGVTGIHRAVKIVFRASFSEDRPYEREFSGIKKFQAVSHAQENLVNILHVGRNDAEGYFFYVMELADPAGAASPFRVPGSDLDASGYQSGTLKQLMQARGRLPVEECLRLAKGLAHAIGHLHVHGLIHRDIKPSNVIFVNGVPKLADIGLVAGLDESRSFVGTEGFVPPEGPGSVSADLFALGRLLYEMGTGRDRLDYPKLPEDFDQLPDRAALLEFNEIILKAGDPERARRYESAADLVRDLLLLEAGKSVRRLRLLETRFALALRTATVAVVVTVIAVAAWLWAASQAREARRNFAKSERHRLEAEAALRDVLLNQVRANRQSGWAGQRLESLQRLRENPAITNNLAFRNEAIACLALPDIRPWRTIPLPVGRGVRLALDRQITRYATNDPRGAIHVRATADDRLLQVLPSPGAGVYRLGFSEDGRQIGASYLNLRFLAWELDRQPAPTDAPAAKDGASWTWDTLPASARPERVRLPVGSVSGAGVPGANELAIVTSDQRVHFLNPTSGVASRVVSGDFPPAGIRFNANGRKFATARSNECLVYRSGNGEKVHALVHPAPVTALAWHPDGRRLATSCFDFKIRIWDTLTGQQLSGFEDHEAEVNGVEFDDTGTLLASTSWDRTTRLWSPDSARALVRVRGSGNGLCLAADGTRLAYSTWGGGELVILEILPARELVTFESFRGIYGLEFSPDGRFFAAGSTEGLHVWQWPHFQPIATLPVRDSSAPAFLPDGTALLAAGRGLATEWPFRADDAAGLLRVGPAREIADVGAGHAAHLRLSPDGLTSALLTESRFRLLRRAGQDWTPVWTVPGRVAGAAFHPDREWLAVARTSERLELWDAERKSVTNFASIHASIARFTPDGRWLVVPGTNAYRAFRVGTWEEGPQVPLPASTFHRGQFALNGTARLGAFRTSDRELSLIDLGSWETVAILPVPLYASGVAFTPDGRRLGVSTEKRGVQVWDLGTIRSGLAAMGLDWAPGAAVAPAEGRAAGRTGPGSVGDFVGPASSAGSVPRRLLPWVEVDRPLRTNASPALASRLPARPAGAPAEWIDLSGAYNGSLADGWIPGFDLGPTADHALPIPTGTNRWGGIDFDVRGVVQLTSTVLASRKGGFPEQVSGLPIGRECRRVHFLHGTDWTTKPGTTIGGYVVRYVTGEEAFVPITYGRDVVDWWRDPAPDQTVRAEAPIIAWVGTNAASRRQNSSVRVYRSSWENPRWDTPIQTIDFFSTRTACGPFLLGVTVE